METAIQQLEAIGERIVKAARRAGRDPQSITLLAVTKTVPVERVLPYIQAGVRHVGENRVQEALMKYSSPLNPRPSLHLIGPLQSNKAGKAAAFFDVIQSVDRWELAEDLDRHAGVLGKTLDCLIQVKISDEPTKSGLDPSAVKDFIIRAGSLSHLKVQGLMGIPPLTAVGDAARPYFQKLRRLYEETFHLLSPGPTHILSMGMSSDFEIAIEEGSTMVRLGSVLFGSRTNPL